jgi:hypothetical protein
MSSTVNQVEFRGNDVAMYGEIIIDMYTPEPATPMVSPRPKDTGNETHSSKKKATTSPSRQYRELKRIRN